METPEEMELEKFIHKQLQKLPQREAPDQIVSNVMARIAARRSLPWWRQPFTEWPLGSQIVLMAVLIALCTGVVLALGNSLQQASLTALYERALSLSWIGEVATTIGNAFLMALRGIALQWLLAGAAVVMIMYGVCIAGGLALYRIASTHSLRNS